MFDHPVYKLDQNSALLDKFLTEKIPKKKTVKVGDGNTAAIYRVSHAKRVLQH